ncbi:hypothetical protein VPH35_045002 [Triticum aestivum]
MHLVSLQLQVSTSAVNKKGPCDRASIFFHRGRHRPSASRPPCHKILLSKVSIIVQFQKSFRKKCKRKMEQES